jgi:hypothetical protein
MGPVQTGVADGDFLQRLQARRGTDGLNVSARYIVRVIPLMSNIVREAALGENSDEVDRKTL